MKASWHVLETTPLLWNWHLDAICDHVEALVLDWLAVRQGRSTNQRFRNLLINVPPGSCKSRIVSVCLPAWFWLHDPTWKVLFVSANPRVAVRDSVYCRDLILSDWYQRTFQPSWRLREDQNAKTSFWNTCGGIRSAFGINSRITGDRVDAVVFDDPHDAQEALSRVKRENVIERWNNAIANRLVNHRHSIRLGIMQRVHLEDLSGHLLRSGDWTHLRIRQEFAGHDPPTPLGWVDPRSEHGQLLHPERFPPDEIAKEKRNPFYWSAQHQQDPIPETGALCNPRWFGEYEELPVLEQVVTSVDSAFSESDVSDPWAVITFGLHQGLIYVLDVRVRQCNYPDGKRMVLAAMAAHSSDLLLIEDAASGQALVDDLRVDYPQIAVVPIKPRGTKTQRFAAVTPLIEAGRVVLPKYASWKTDYITELCGFPFAPHDDQVDATSQFLQWWKTRPIFVVPKDIIKKY